MLATHRRAAIVASLMLTVSGLSSAFAQGTAAPGTRPPAGAGAGTRPTGTAPVGGGTAAPSRSTGAAPAVRPAGATAPVAPSNASQAPANSALTGGSPSVVVIDIGEVFKKHLVFNQQVEAIKKDMKDLEALVQTEQKRLLDSKAKLADYNPGSPEYRKHEEELTHLASDLQVKATLRQKEIYEQEAKVYYSTYVEISKQVEEFADRYGVSLVLRNSNAPMDPLKRDTVFRGMERQIIFQRNLDITNEIIAQVNRRATATATQPKGPASGRPASGTSRQ